jgi:hypothetical protein
MVVKLSSSRLGLLMRDSVPNPEIIKAVIVSTFGSCR